MSRRPDRRLPRSPRPRSGRHLAARSRDRRAAGVAGGVAGRAEAETPGTAARPPRRKPPAARPRTRVLRLRPLRKRASRRQRTEKSHLGKGPLGRGRLTRTASPCPKIPSRSKRRPATKTLRTMLATTTPRPCTGRSPRGKKWSGSWLTPTWRRGPRNPDRGRSGGHSRSGRGRRAADPRPGGTEGGWRDQPHAIPSPRPGCPAPRVGPAGNPPAHRRGPFDPGGRSADCRPAGRQPPGRPADGGLRLGPGRRAGRVRASAATRATRRAARA